MEKKAKTQQKSLSNVTKAFIKVAAAISIIGGTSGLIFGLTAGLSKNLGYVNLQPYLLRKEPLDPETGTDYSMLKDKSAWLSTDTSEEPINEISEIYLQRQIDESNPLSTIDNSISNEDLFDYSQLIIDSNAHVTMDKSFNESSYLGLTNWVHQKDPRLTGETWKAGDGIRIKMTELTDPTSTYADGVYSAQSDKPTSDDNKGFIDAYIAAINGIEQSDLQKGSIVLAGFLHATPLAQFITHEHPRFEKAGYILLDADYSDLNIASTAFRSDQASFLCGIAVCEYLQQKYDDVYSKVNNGKLAVGTFGGMAIPTVTSFMGGFEWGIYFYNHFILPHFDGYNSWDKETIAKRTVDVICAGKATSFFTNSFNTGDARLLVQQLLTQGADVILPVAGPQTIDAVNEVRSQHSPALVVGVDTDQENGELSSYTSLSPLNYGEKIIQFSAQKNLAGITSLILQAQAKGVRGYYYDSNGDVKCLSYDGVQLRDAKDGEEYVADSFVGNSGYLTVGNVSNSGVMISKGDETNYDPTDPLGGTGWDSLRSALAHIVPDVIFNKYSELIAFLGKYRIDIQDPYDPGRKHNTNAFEMLDENKYFLFR